MQEAPSVESLLENLRNDSYDVRADAARRLRDLPLEEVPPKLLEAVEDDDFSVRLAAVEALSGKSEEHIIAILEQALFDEEWEVQWAALRSLGSALKEPDLRKMGDKLPEKRIAGIEALAKKKASHLLKPLLACLDDEMEEVQAAGIRALAKVGDPAAIGPLRELLDETREEELKALIAEALSDLGDAEIRAQAHEYLLACDECGHRLPPSYLYHISQWGEDDKRLCRFHYDEFTEQSKPFIGKLKQCKLCKRQWPKVELVEGTCPECRDKRYNSLAPAPENQFRCYRSHKLRPMRDLSPVSEADQPLASKSAQQEASMVANSPFLASRSIDFLERAFDNGYLLCETCGHFRALEEIVEGDDFRDKCVCAKCHK